MDPILEVRNLESGYGDVQILWGVNLALQEGKLTALVGANGAGKTTLLRTIMGQIPAIRGEVLLMGKEMLNTSIHAKAERGMVLVPEGRQLFTSMTVEENLEMGATPGHARPHFRRNLEHVYELFPRLKERRRQVASTMSGGEQQMLAMGRGLMAEPTVLMIDEMSMGLSPSLTLQLFETLTVLRKTGLTLLLVEQNVQMALAISDYAFVLSQGKVELEGPSKDLLQNPKVQAAYLGMVA
jgi:branched-chain amino acid transport system ATP-binding protein